MDWKRFSVFTVKVSLNDLKKKTSDMMFDGFFILRNQAPPSNDHDTSLSSEISETFYLKTSFLTSLNCTDYVLVFVVIRWNECCLFISLGTFN